MKKLYIVANWKSNKTTMEAMQWLEFFKNQQIPDNKTVIICPSFTLLSAVAQCIKDNSLPFLLGAQNISSFEEGAYTGEVNGKQLKEFCEYVIVGHSERRASGETYEMLEQKVQQIKESGLHSIYCVQDKNTSIPEGVNIIAYEPIEAIGTGIPDSPENAEEIASYFKKEKNAQTVLYGGSVKENNSSLLASQPSIDGILVGGASLDAEEFLHIIENA